MLKCEADTLPFVVVAIDYRLARAPHANPVPDAVLLVTLFVSLNVIAVLLAIDSIIDWRAYLPRSEFGAVIWVGALVVLVGAANYIVLATGDKGAIAIAAARSKRPLQSKYVRRWLLVYIAVSFLAAPLLGYLTARAKG